MPPKIYEKLPDSNDEINEDEYDYENDDNDDEDFDNENKKKDTQNILDDIIDESDIPKKNVNDEIGGAFIMQVCLYIFSIIVIIGFLGFIVFLYIRYKRNARFLKSEYLIKKTTELSTKV